MTREVWNNWWFRGQVQVGGTGDTVDLISGSGSPEGVVTAGIGSIYLRYDGSTGTTFYIKESGAGNTGWRGVSSNEGLPGLDGQIGSTGVTGITGVTGVTGTTGVTGVTGVGVTGVTGVTGPEGLHGIDGQISSIKSFSVGALIEGAPPSNGFRMVWRAPLACTVTNVRGHIDAGTNAVVNARKNQTSDFLSSDLTVSSTNTWTDGGAVQNIAVAAGDDIEIELVSTSGAVTKVNIQVDLVA